MKAVEPAPDFILFGGDVFGHVPADHENAETMRESHHQFAKALNASFPDTLILPCLGNHDTMPYFVSGADARESLSQMASLYGSGLAPEQRKSLASRGYYLHKFSRHLWLVVLETNALSISRCHHRLRPSPF